jgi:uncharacterized sporulation protein YeaH/YhbH (DUF444 family)
MEVEIDSSESEGIYENHITDKLDSIINDVLENGLDPEGDNVTVEADVVQAPTFTYDDSGKGGKGSGGKGPGRGGGGGVQFTLPLDKFMQLVAKKLMLPNLVKEGQGKITEVSYEYKTFGNTGIILDKKRTFKQALKTSIGTGEYQPENDINYQRRLKNQNSKL